MAKDSGAILQKITSENFHFINFNFNDISLSSAFTNGINYFITSDVHNIDQDENKSLLAKSFSQINFKNLYNNSEVSFINFRTNTNIENHLFEYCK
ncbi:hypothetical protein PACTADRAFT_75634 [Pachysolen tannophilus NRRL Y-2460]|uniref:Uncharacterized protein n=1 Tax=Pachysolen tannophilus NRRL Y-2460 TaxID=669874 RepID=A0A1E4TTI4_PACTA|nr:hypothetical protein PACTADRAFT_75634 [Pachysolen tannophilus NRRL Y-2460]